MVRPRRFHTTHKSHLPSRETYLPSRETVITPDDVFCKTIITHNIMSTIYVLDLEMDLEMGLEMDLEMDVEMNLEMDLELDVEMGLEMGLEMDHHFVVALQKDSASLP